MIQCLWKVRSSEELALWQCNAPLLPGTMKHHVRHTWAGLAQHGLLGGQETSMSPENTMERNK